MGKLQSNIRKLYAFSFLQMTLFPMAVITLFWKDQIGLSLTQILLLIPSSRRAGILSLQSFTFRLLFVITGPVIGMLADEYGVRQSFQYLLIAFLLLLPPLTFSYLRHLQEDES